MINVRLVSQIVKDGSTFTLVNIKVTGENPDAMKTVTAIKGVEQQFTNVSDLFNAIEAETVALIQSGFV